MDVRRVVLIDRTGSYGGHDWRAHLTKAERRPVGDGIFLAEAVARIGEALIEGWHPQMFESLQASIPVVSIPSTLVAFDPDGDPVPEVHAAWGPVVREIMPPGEWQALVLELTDRQAWEGSHRFDEMIKGPLPEGVLRSRAGEDARESITEDNWQAAYENSTMEMHFRRVAEENADAILAALVAMTKDEQVHLSAISMRSLRPRELGRTAWTGDHTRCLGMLATCRADPDNPDDLIFVEADGFDEAVASYASRHYLPLLPPDASSSDSEPEDDDIEEEPSITNLEDAERLTRRVLEPLLGKPINNNWRTKDLKLVVSKLDFIVADPEDKDRIVDALREHWLRREKFKFLADAGQPRVAGRPTRMGSGSLNNLVAQIRAAAKAGDLI